jgi:DNA-binding SARP family transcriptional activator
MRARTDAEDDPAAPDGRDAGTQLPLVLITSADRRSAARIHAVLEAGAGAGAAGIVLGDWPAGTTCHVSTDGTVSSADPRLAGIRAFHLTASDLSSVLSLLRGARGHITRDEPRPAAPRLRQEPAASQHRTQAQPPQEPDGSTGGGQAEARPRIAPEPPGRHPARPAFAGTGPPARSPAGTDDAAPSAPLSSGTPPAATVPGSAKAVEITMLGTLRIAAGGADIRGGLRKARELLAYLALHPDGVSGEAISEALWPDSDPRYAARQRHLALRKARDILRTATGLPRPMFIILASERYRLDPALAGADLWRFDAALARARAAASDGAQLAALRQAAALYQGPLADGSGYDWAERYAEQARRRALDALARIADLLQPADPEQALQALETAIAHDPYNEAVYQKIMHLQARLGRPDAVTRTLRLLQARLAELDLSPDPATLRAASVTAGYLASYPRASPPPADRSPAGQPPRPRGRDGVARPPGRDDRPQTRLAPPGKAR